MNQDEYLKERLENQIKWYDKKSISAQKEFSWLRHVEIVFAAIIPLIVVVNGLFPKITIYASLLIALIGVLISIVSGFIAFGQHQEHWIEFRTTCESLKKEKYLFLTKAEPYNYKNSFDILVQKVETLVSKENTNWAQYNIKNKKGDKDGK